ncbi:MAG: hypothetical protein ACE15D_03235 [Candidatus Eisenbacteria bacterium]|nr:hypothetical protein [Candidatus Eisenbacteria bacterium]
MSIVRRTRWTAVAVLIGAASVALAAAPPLLSDGGFDGSTTSKLLRRNTKGQDWYESRYDVKGSRAMLKLDKTAIAGNATPKARIDGSAKFNTYLTQKFVKAQKTDFSFSCDICVQSIDPSFNRSAFILIGNDADKKNGPNSTGNERFVFLGFENSATKGKMNLFARQGKGAWEQRTVIARDLDLGRWYTIEGTVYPADGIYEVLVRSVTPKPVELKAFGRAPKTLTAISFASWNDGPGTFYVDNVSASGE